MFLAPDRDGTVRRQVVVQSGQGEGNLTNLLGPLYEPVLTGCLPDALVFKGLVLEGGGEVAQEWLVRFAV